jgi:hypothetical protein
MTDLSLLSLIQAGLVWSATMAYADVVRTATSYVYPNDKEKALEAQIIYATILTVIVILIFYFIQKTKSDFAKLEKILEDKFDAMQKMQKMQKNAATKQS